MRPFLTAQRAVLKVYLINEIERSPSYGWAYKTAIAGKNKWYRPSPSEIYKALLELTKAGVVTRKRRRKPESEFQDVVVYTFTEDGHHKAQVYKKQVKVDLERSQKTIAAILKDNY